MVRSNLQLQFFSVGGIGTAITIAKMGAQHIL